MPVSPDGKSTSVGRYRHYCFPSQTLRSAVLRRAESVCVLCGKYSSTLRRVRFGTPQGILLFYAGGWWEMSVAFHCVVGDGGTAAGGVAEGRQPFQALSAYLLLRSGKRPDGVVLMDELLLQVQGHKKSALFRGRFSYGLMCVEALYSSLPSRLAFTSGLCL